MLQLIKKIFIEAGYSLNERSKPLIPLFEKQDMEYFLLAEYSIDEISDFFVNEKTKTLLSFFEDSKKTISDFEKNTSLVICLKVTNLQGDTERFKNLIYKIEEDEYFFKKYVITYTDNSINTLTDLDTVINTIHEKILEPNKFNEFRNNYFFNDEYFVLVQLFVKLPFLSFEQSDQEFQNLSEILRIKLTQTDLTTIETLVLNSSLLFNEPKDMFLGGEENNDELEQYIESFQNQNDED